MSQNIIPPDNDIPNFGDPCHGFFIHSNSCRRSLDTCIGRWPTRTVTSSVWRHVLVVVGVVVSVTRAISANSIGWSFVTQRRKMTYGNMSPKLLLMRRVSGMRSNWKWLASCLCKTMWRWRPSSHPSVGKQRAGTVGCPTWWQLFVCQLVLFGRLCSGTQQTLCGDCGLFAQIRIWVPPWFDTHFQSYDADLAAMSRESTYGDDLCVQAAAHLMMRPIHVISDISDEAYSETIFSPPRSIAEAAWGFPVVVACYVKGRHYEATASLDAWGVRATAAKKDWTQS